ncbi:MAG: type II toxin-antitoxin system HicB family antitoxin [Proteobacteria bacterium]|nr:type II toxin-antitoxin system HicB family antitoxin [Pseudomonadota bacterium]
MLVYKNYIGHVQFDDEADIFYGEVINTRDVITFQGSTVRELKKAFKESIEDYLAFCAERNEAPDKPFSGKFNLRLNPELHREVYVAAKQSGKSLNQWVLDAISFHLHEKFA